MWPKLEACNQLDAQARGEWLVQQGLPTSNPELVRIVNEFFYDLVGRDRADVIRRIPVSFNATLYRGSDGAIQGVFAVARDLSAD